MNHCHEYTYPHQDKRDGHDIGKHVEAFAVENVAHDFCGSYL